MSRSGTVDITFNAILFGIFTVPLSLLGQLLNRFLISPWGLVVPMTLLIALFALQQVHQTPRQLALFYAEQLETCEDAEIPRLLRILVKMEDAGVSGLVQGLTSQRESVFTACLHALQHQFGLWQTSPAREHHYCIFSEAVLQASDQFSPTAQVEVLRFIDQMMQVRMAEASPETTADRQKMIALCGQILERLDGMRQRRNDPADPAFAALNHSIASLHQRSQRPVLLASNGKPFVPTSARYGVKEPSNETVLAEAERVNPFSVPRAERLLAYQNMMSRQPAQYHQSAQNYWPENHLDESGNPRLPDDRELTGFASFAPPSPFVAEMERHIAQNFAPHSIDFKEADIKKSDVKGAGFDISEDYRNQKQSEAEASFGRDDFLSPELRTMPLEQVPKVPTSQLMQLLHHPEGSYVESARRTLVSRDGFLESHLRLAWRLYHPRAAVRQEIVAMLPGTANVQPSVWLSVLLNDPSNEVRYRAASFLATARDPALHRLLIERGKRDSDARIVYLADRLDESVRR